MSTDQNIPHSKVCDAMNWCDFSDSAPNSGWKYIVRGTDLHELTGKFYKFLETCAVVNTVNESDDIVTLSVYTAHNGHRISGMLSLQKDISDVHITWTRNRSAKNDRFTNGVFLYFLLNNVVGSVTTPRIYAMCDTPMSISAKPCTVFVEMLTGSQCDKLVAVYGMLLNPELYIEYADVIAGVLYDATIYKDDSPSDIIPAFALLLSKMLPSDGANDVALKVAKTLITGMSPSDPIDIQSCITALMVIASKNLSVRQMLCDLSSYCPMGAALIRAITRGPCSVNGTPFMSSSSIGLIKLLCQFVLSSEKCTDYDFMCESIVIGALLNARDAFESTGTVSIGYKEVIEMLLDYIQKLIECLEKLREPHVELSSDYCELRETLDRIEQNDTLSK